MNIKRDAIVTNDEYEPFLDFDEKGHVCSKQEKDQRGSDHEEHFKEQHLQRRF
jgi:hypothetical protein